MEHDVEKLTDAQLETRRRLWDAKVARLDRERNAMVAELARARVALNEVEQEQQNRAAEKAWERRGRALDQSLAPASWEARRSLA